MMRLHFKNVVIIALIILGIVLFQDRPDVHAQPRPGRSKRTVEQGQVDAAKESAVLPNLPVSREPPQRAPETTRATPAPTKPWATKLTVPPDFRDKECVPEHQRLMALPEGTLPDTSVIFCFCNEPTVSLYHSMHSVIERSPRHLLHEIILVDDGSDAPHIGKPLEEYVKTLPIPVKIVRMGSRVGLMRARVAGARAASGKTLTFLDSHISCDIGWLEPLMFRISQDRSHIVMPMIDGADRQFHYKPGGIALVGFNTGLVDHGMRLQTKDAFEGRTSIHPQPSPAMAGGLFSVERSFFFEIGAFDEGMAHWGGENIELGFRAWQCGGSIELMPCSRVAHVFGGMGKSCGWPGAPPGNINKWRAIETWTDGYKGFFEMFMNKAPADVGDLTKMFDLRKNLKCKSFAWFLENVFPECWINQIVSAKFQGILENQKSMTCYNPGSTRTISQDGGKMEPCATSKGFRGNTQYMWLTGKDELLPNPPLISYDMDQCLESNVAVGQQIRMYACHGFRGKQEWLYDPSTMLLRHGIFCLGETKQNGLLQPHVVKCVEGDASMQWKWRTVDNFTPPKIDESRNP
eukprot:m.270605 g.270605  ORF g.270605 m.270605 type:complete len:576 (-) comp26851_c0_seq4:211-1938(-)